MDETLVGQYIARVKQLKKKFGLAGEIDVAMLADIPDLIQVREVEIDSASERKTVVKALTAAIGNWNKRASVKAAICGQIWRSK